MTLLLSAVIIGYVILIFTYLYGWRRQVRGERRPLRVHGPVSVIVPARNEEENIVACIRSLMDQKYDGEFEVIVVDDHSEDATAGLINAEFDGERRLRALRLEKSEEGKKAALRAGIAAARGEYIVTVDGDCVVGNKWLDALMSEFEYGVQVVTGPVFIRRAEREIEGFQALDLMSLAMVTGGGHYFGLHALGNGANLVFRREAFDEVGGYDKGADFASGDDLFLLQSIAERYGLEAIAYQGDPEGAVWTDPERSVDALIRQRLRWASKNSGLGDRSIQLVWAFVWIANVGTIAALSLALLSILPLTFALTFIGLKAGVEFIALRSVATHYSQGDLFRRWFPQGFLLNIAYVTLIGVKSLSNQTYTWKGRRTS